MLHPNNKEVAYELVSRRKRNTKSSLLSFLKNEKQSSARFRMLDNLSINETWKNYLSPSRTPNSNELKATLLLFPDLDRFEALKILVKYYDIKLSELEAQKIKTCLLRDPSFKSLSPFIQKNFDGIFLYKPEKKVASLLVNKSIEKTIDLIKNPNLNIRSEQNNKKSTIVQKQSRAKNFNTFLEVFLSSDEKNKENLFYSQKNLTYFKDGTNITHLFRHIPKETVQKYLSFKDIAQAIDTVKFSWSDIENLVGADQKTIYYFLNFLVQKNKLLSVIENLEQFKFLLKMLAPENRLNFLKLPKIIPIFKNKVLHMQIKDLKDFNRRDMESTKCEVKEPAIGVR